MVCFKKPLRHLGDFDVGQARISFADIQQSVAVAHRESVVAQNADALAVAVFHRGYDYIERGQFAFQFEPRFSSASRACRPTQDL